MPKGGSNGAGFRNYTGSTGSYSYDANGNLSADPYKGLTLAYDYLNRTDKITVTTATNRYINYTYDASGQLIRKQAYDNGALGTTTDYIDGFVYLTQGTGTTSLSYFPVPEGRVLNNAGTLTQEFVITDQQGNARLSFQDKGNGTPVVKQENSYYAFGMVMANSPVPQPTVPNKQLYNGGSEWQNDYSNQPDYYQTFHRNYDAALGRWTGVDPMAEASESMTPYQYANNNPLLFNDPLGNKSAEEWNEIINELWNSPYGGHESDGDSDPTFFGSNEEGIAYVLGGGSGGSGGGGGNGGSNGGGNGSAGNSNNGSNGGLTQLISVLQGEDISTGKNGITSWNYFSYTEPNPLYDPVTNPGTTPYITYIGSTKNFISWNDLGEALMDHISNSESPDLVGIGINGNVVDEFGAGVNISAFGITRGDYRGFYVTATPSARIGEENGTSYSTFTGTYFGNSNSPNPYDFLGNTIEIGSSNTSGVYTWWSFTGSDPTNISWLGIGKTFGPDVGSSAGYGYTYGIFGFSKQ